MSKDISTYFYRLFSWLSHRLSAGNTGGYGVHSPMLFELTRNVMTDRNVYYCFSSIEHQRRVLLSSSESVYVDDYGTGVSGVRRVADIAVSSLKSPKEAQLLMRIAVMNHAKEIVELGTSLGITTAYLASVGSDVRVTTYEAAKEVIRQAEKVWSRLKLENISVVQGNITESLVSYEPKGQFVDMAFIDANHTGDATLDYFNTLAHFAGADSVYVIDDIHSSPDMESAWHTIQKRNDVTATIDVYSMGLVFFDKNLEKRGYKVRL